MPWRQHGRARVDPSNPSAFGSCDRCGFLHNLNDLVWQFEWRGTQLQNTRFRVCRICLDVPQEQLRAKLLGPDPLPVPNPRPEMYAEEEGPTPAIWSPRQAVEPPAPFTLDASLLDGDDVLE